MAARWGAMYCRNVLVVIAGFFYISILNVCLKQRGCFTLPIVKHKSVPKHEPSVWGIVIPLSASKARAQISVICILNLFRAIHSIGSVAREASADLHHFDLLGPGFGKENNVTSVGRNTSEIFGLSMGKQTQLIRKFDVVLVVTMEEARRAVDTVDETINHGTTVFKNYFASLLEGVLRADSIREQFGCDIWSGDDDIQVTTHYENAEKRHKEAEEKVFDHGTKPKLRGMKTNRKSLSTGKNITEQQDPQETAGLILTVYLRNSIKINIRWLIVRDLPQGIQIPMKLIGGWEHILEVGKQDVRFLSHFDDDLMVSEDFFLATLSIMHTGHHDLLFHERAQTLLPSHYPTSYYPYVSTGYRSRNMPEMLYGASYSFSVDLYCSRILPFFRKILEKMLHLRQFALDNDLENEKVAFLTQVNGNQSIIHQKVHLRRPTLQWTALLEDGPLVAFPWYRFHNGRKRVKKSADKFQERLFEWTGVYHFPWDEMMFNLVRGDKERYLSKETDYLSSDNLCTTTLFREVLEMERYLPTLPKMVYNATIKQHKWYHKQYWKPHGVVPVKNERTNETITDFRGVEQKRNRTMAPIVVNYDADNLEAPVALQDHSEVLPYSQHQYVRWAIRENIPSFSFHVNSPDSVHKMIEECPFKYVLDTCQRDMLKHLSAKQTVAMCDPKL